MKPAAPVTRTVTDPLFARRVWRRSRRAAGDQPVLQQLQHRVAERDMALLDASGLGIGHDQSVIARIDRRLAVAAQKTDRDDPHLARRLKRQDYVLRTPGCRDPEQHVARPAKSAQGSLEY